MKSYLPSLIVSLRCGRSFRAAGGSEGLFFKSLGLLWFYPCYLAFCVPAFFIPVFIIRLKASVFKKLNLLANYIRAASGLSVPRRFNS